MIPVWRELSKLPSLATDRIEEDAAVDGLDQNRGMQDATQDRDSEYYLAADLHAVKCAYSSTRYRSTYLVTWSST